MIFDTIIQSAIHTWGLMWVSPIIPAWFVVTTVLATAFAMKVNHLDGKRWFFYVFLCTILFIGSEGSKIHYIVSVLHVPPATPTLWSYPFFGFTFWTSIITGVTIGYLINKATELFFEDFYLSLATYAYRMGEGWLRRSKAFNILGVTSMEGLHKLVLEKQKELAAVESAGDQEKPNGSPSSP